MNLNQEQAATVNMLKIFSSSKFSWIVLGVWLAYSAMMLWYFKEQTNLNISVCKVAS